MDRATRIAAYLFGFILFLAAVAVFAQSLSNGSVASEWKLPCGLVIGSMFSFGVGWIMGTAGAPESGCSAGSDDSSGEGQRRGWRCDLTPAFERTRRQAASFAEHRWRRAAQLGR
jgi:hypothetical protein